MRALFLILISLCTFEANAQELVVEGAYQGKNLYIQNPWVNDSTFCIIEVTVNGVVLADSTASSAFEIKLDTMGLEFNEHVVIIFKHHPECKPRILNPEIH